MQNTDSYPLQRPPSPNCQTHITVVKLSSIQMCDLNTRVIEQNTDCYPLQLPPSPTSQTHRIVVKSSSTRIMSAASLETSVPDIPMEMPISALFSATASFTPSPVIPTTAPFCCKAWPQHDTVHGSSTSATVLAMNPPFHHNHHIEYVADKVGCLTSQTYTFTNNHFDQMDDNLKPMPLLLTVIKQACLLQMSQA